MQDLELITKLHTRDIVSLVAVLMKEKPAASLVVPLEVRDWFEKFC
jgi:hypothetical protein